MGDVAGEVVPVILKSTPQLHTVLAPRVIWLSGAPVCVGHGEVRLHPLEHALRFYVVSAQPIGYLVLIGGWISCCECMCSQRKTQIDLIRKNLNIIHWRYLQKYFNEYFLILRIWYLVKALLCFTCTICRIKLHTSLKFEEINNVLRKFQCLNIMEYSVHYNHFYIIFSSHLLYSL